MDEDVAAIPPAVGNQARRLSESPDWQYLLREYYEMYRASSAGGSQTIAAHQRKVRQAVAGVLETDPELRAVEPAAKPVTAHLRRALDRGRLSQASSVIRAIESVAPRLQWEFGYEAVPKHLFGKYAYAELMGPSSRIPSPRLILGLVLFAPKCIYPTHSHQGLTESYYCLSGAFSQNDQGVFAPGSMIFNPPGRQHRITTDANEPCLIAYAWSGPEDVLANQKMRFDRARRSGAPRP